MNYTDLDLDLYSGILCPITFPLSIISLKGSCFLLNEFILLQGVLPSLF